MWHTDRSAGRMFSGAPVAPFQPGPPCVGFLGSNKTLCSFLLLPYFLGWWGEPCSFYPFPLLKSSLLDWFLVSNGTVVDKTPPGLCDAPFLRSSQYTERNTGLCFSFLLPTVLSPSSPSSPPSSVSPPLSSPFSSLPLLLLCPHLVFPLTHTAPVINVQIYLIGLTPLAPSSYIYDTNIIITHCLHLQYTHRITSKPRGSKARVNTNHITLSIGEHICPGQSLLWDGRLVLARISSSEILTWASMVVSHRVYLCGWQAHSVWQKPPVVCTWLQESPYLWVLVSPKQEMLEREKVAISLITQSQKPHSVSVRRAIQSSIQLKEKVLAYWRGNAKDFFSFHFIAATNIAPTCSFLSSSPPSLEDPWSWS